MRVPSDLPRRPPRRESGRLGNRGRVLLIALFVVLVVLFVSARSFAGFYVEVLWFRSVDRTDVFWGVLRTKVLLAVAFTVGFAAVAWASLTVADRLAPLVRSDGPEEQVLERYRELIGPRQGLLRIAVAVLFGLIAGLPASAHWEDWTLFRNAVSFGATDEQFGTDIGFYVFRLPFLNYLVNWLFAAFVVIFLLTAVAHYLNGGIRLQPGGRRVTPQVKLHLSALLVVLALLKAADYWLQRFELTTSKRGYVEGATYTDVNAQLPALQLLILISLLAAVLLLVNVRQKGWRLPVIAVGLWLVVAVIAGTLYPAVVQRFQVEPSQSTREAEFIARNIRATRAAMNLQDVSVVPMSLGDISADEVIEDQDAIGDVRLLAPRVIDETFRVDQGLRTSYVVGGATRDVDVDRYEIDGRMQQVVLAARELDLDNIPLKTWEGQHLAYTHGYGLAFAPASQVDQEGFPNYVSVDDPENDLGLTRPQVYFGDRLGGYAVVGSARQGGEESLDETRPPYAGAGGVQLSSGLRRAAFAVYYGEYNLFGSRLIDDDSRIIYHRDVRERVAKVAPFLKFDADPYPVVLDEDGDGESNLVWVVDAYTTTSRYPNAESADTRQLPDGSGLRSAFNYARNSVKAVVDAYDGDITLYVVDAADPIVRAWQKAFPDLFTDGTEASDALREHFRYPEDLFRVQTNLYGRYQVDSATDFYTQQRAWSVAQAAPSEQVATARAAGAATGTGVTETTIANNTGRTSDLDTARFEPYYTLFKAPGAEESEFVMLRPFVPFSTDDGRKELQAFMTVSSEPENYGQLTVYEIPGSRLPLGPLTVATNISQKFSTELTLLDSRGTRVVFGDLQIVPVGDGLMYVRPWFLQPENLEPQRASFYKVSITYGNDSVNGESLEEALRGLYAGIDLQIGDRPSGTSASGGPAGAVDEENVTPPASSTDADATVEELIAAAEERYAEAQVALEEFDSKTYQQKMDEAYELLARAAEAATGLEISPGTTTTVPAEPTETTVDDTAAGG